MARPNETVDNLGALVRERRTSQGMTQVTLADLAGCHWSFIHDIEQGKPSLRLDKLVAVLDVLGLELRVIER